MDNAASTIDRQKKEILEYLLLSYKIDIQNTIFSLCKKQKHNMERFSGNAAIRMVLCARNHDIGADLVYKHSRSMEIE